MSPPTLGATLRRLYFIRFGFAVVWAALLLLTASSVGLLLTVLVVIYPLVDAIAVSWLLRSEGSAQASRVPELINVVASVIAAIALGWASTVSVSGALAAWGAWAAIAGLVQLIAAVLRESAATRSSVESSSSSPRSA